MAKRTPKPVEASEKKAPAKPKAQKSQAEKPKRQRAKKETLKPTKTQAPTTTPVKTAEAKPSRGRKLKEALVAEPDYRPAVTVRDYSRSPASFIGAPINGAQSQLEPEGCAYKSELKLSDLSATDYPSGPTLASFTLRKGDQGLSDVPRHPAKSVTVDPNCLSSDVLCS